MPQATALIGLSSLLDKLCSGETGKQKHGRKGGAHDPGRCPLLQPAAWPETARLRFQETSRSLEAASRSVGASGWGAGAGGVEGLLSGVKKNVLEQMVVMVAQHF